MCTDIYVNKAECLSVYLVSIAVCIKIYSGSIGLLCEASKHTNFAVLDAHWVGDSFQKNISASLIIWWVID